MNHYNQTMMLSEALMDYKVALAVFTSSHSSLIETLPPIVLGCITNMGHIVSHFGRNQEAGECYEMLNDILDSPHAENLSDDDAAFFFSLISDREVLFPQMAAAA